MQRGEENVEIIKRDDWTFWIDWEKTRDFYAMSTSITPRISSKLKVLIPDFAAFLEQMGIDILKPLDVDNPDYFDDLLYFAYGKAESLTGYELDFYYKSEALVVSVAVYYPSDFDDEKLDKWGIPSPRTDMVLFTVFLNITSDWEGK